MTSPITPSNHLEALTEGEVFWRDNYEWLKEKGYQLRSRYAPDWIPSWKTSGKPRYRSEDSHPLLNTQINDAIHVDTGSRVALKRLNTKDHPSEESIMRFFSSELLSKDPHNHCIRLLDVLHPLCKDGDDEVIILVMHFLHPFNTPNFDTFGEAIGCIRELFEGVEFMHENRVAHRDLKPDNLMMEADKMFPEGFHPRRDLRKGDLSGPAKFYTRTQCPSKYFLIDLGMSRQYESGNDPAPEAAMVGEEVRMQTPFQADVCLAGELVREIFIDGHPILTHIRGYRGFDFLRPLINDMVQDDPTKRPQMKDVVNRFNVIAHGLSTWKLRSRTSSRRANVFQDRKITFMIEGTSAIPVN
ncbi:kinase-like domain-containing protein [Gymnopilus junonius]|uniref:Kinase-like domain-containing protein n=1 Tax=Gymnopilus junonius TaxID=109634 RepID=A0A9P5NG25_GYMJU|nr:kinase-like domain-containing protein [Gymnopilus junonius]